MKRLEKINLVQFFVCDAEEIPIKGHAALLGANGTGKTALLDAIQIAMLGADRRYLAFNARKAFKASNRDLRSYCLGAFKPDGDEESGIIRRKRDTAHTYITLVFRDSRTAEPISIGVAMTASIQETTHRVKGLYVANGVALGLNDHTEIGANGDKQPLPWKDFEARLRTLSRNAGREQGLEITDQPEKHIRALLHALQPKGFSIDPHEYQKAFKKSLLLNQVENVSDFVRDFLVDQEKIDKDRAMAHIREFRRLQDIIEEVKDQIERLSGLERQYGVVQREHKRSATYAALQSTYEVESACERQSACDDRLEKRRSDLTSVKAKLGELDSLIEKTELQLQSIYEAKSGSAVAQQLESNRKVLGERQQALGYSLVDLQKSINGMKTALDGVVSSSHIRCDRASVNRLIERLEAIDRREPSAQSLEELQSTKRAISDFVDQTDQELNRAVSEAREQARQATELYEAEAGSIANERRGGVKLQGGPGIAFAALQNAGIDARPICELIEVSKPEWRPAIESYLGRNRFALLVPAGEVDNAVRLIRAPGRRISGVKIVQPEHLDVKKWETVNESLVGNLVVGDDPVAVAFVRQLLGNIKQVDTEEELRRYPQALTQDGMLSKSGSTESLDLRGELVLGRTAGPVDEAYLQRRLDEAGRKKVEAVGALERLESVLHSLKLVGGAENQDFGVLVERVAQHLTNISETEQAIELLDTSTIDTLNSEESRLKKVKEHTGKESGELNQRLGQLTTEIQNLETSKNRAIEDEENARAAERELRASPDFDPLLADQLRQDLDEDQTGIERPYHLRIQACIEKAEHHQRRAQNRYLAAATEFAAYIDRYGVQLIEERSDWRKALAWIELSKAHLVEAQLQDFLAEAQAAQEVAEESFKRDVAFKLREGIERMQGNMKAINKILDACPPFSNNERYRFKYEVAKPYKELHQFIMNSASEGASEDLFSDNAELNSRILEFLSESHDKDVQAQKSPLDDFRLLFNFDLEILEDGKPFSRLSKRMGTGSNGEHLTPFYVIAAAALTHAYRIDSSNRGGGAALMLLDEAFGAMDDQNAVAAARFMDGLGLQMIMAAPSADNAKLSSFTDTIYELERFGPNLFFHKETITDQGHALLRSDMPSEHPELVQQRMLEYENEHNPG